MEDILQQVALLQAKPQANDLNKTKAINQGSTTQQDHPNNRPPVYSTKNIKTGSYIFIFFGMYYTFLEYSMNLMNSRKEKSSEKGE